MLYPIRHCLAVGLTAVASLAFAQTRPAKKAAPPPAPVVEAPAPAAATRTTPACRAWAAT
jgi:outer membrane protein, adhesin transport system